jgi:cytochrome b subunit of formate dehydrogenase
MNSAAKRSYIVMGLGAAVLAATGIGVFALGTPPMTHWVLMIHIAAAPVFALGLAAVALTWADLCRKGSNPRLGAAAKVLFWIILFCGLVVMLTGVTPMLPLFGSDGQHLLYLTHRYAGIVLAVAILLHLPALRSRPAVNSSATKRQTAS